MLDIKSDISSFFEGVILLSITKLLFELGLSNEDIKHVEYELIITIIHTFFYIIGAIVAGLSMIFLKRYFNKYFNKIDLKINNLINNE
jgi:uncharacterized membrane-anchored protein